MTYLSTRREFLQRGLAMVALAPTIPSFLDTTMTSMARAAELATTRPASGKDGPILVLVQLAGGNDGLNTVVPYADDIYRRKRPTLGVGAAKVLKLDEYVGLHPNLAGLKELYDQGALGIVQGVGYPNPNRSHFRSMDIWQSAQPKVESPRSGWVGRYFDNACPGCEPKVGLAIGGRVPLAMQGERVMPLSFGRPATYRYPGADRAEYEKLIRRPAGGASELDFIERTALDAQLSSDEILRVTRTHAPATSYPAGSFAQSLKTIAALIRGGLPTRVYYATMGGFDTHASERGRHDLLMEQLSAALHAFWADLREQRNHDRVLVMTFSEFGRRVEQNASGGTDHGAAAPMFIIGSRIQQGLIGKHPSLSDLDQGDLKYGIDFRSVYATVLEKWLGAKSGPILGEGFGLLPVVREA